LKRGLTSHSLLHLDSSEPLETCARSKAWSACSTCRVRRRTARDVDDVEATSARMREALRGRASKWKRLERIAPSMEDVFVAMIEARSAKRHEFRACGHLCQGTAPHHARRAHWRWRC